MDCIYYYFIVLVYSLEGDLVVVYFKIFGLLFNLEKVGRCDVYGEVVFGYYFFNVVVFGKDLDRVGVFEKNGLYGFYVL